MFFHTLLRMIKKKQNGVKMKEKKEKSVEKKEAPSVESMELIQFLVRPLNELDKKLSNRLDEIEAIVSRNESEAQVVLQDSSKLFSAFKKLGEKLEVECNRNTAAIGGLQNELKNLSNVKAEIALLNQESDGLKKVVGVLPYMQSQIEERDAESRRMKKDVEMLLSSHVKAEEKLVDHKNESKSKLDELRYLLNGLKERYSKEIASINSQFQPEREERLKNDKVHAEKIDSLTRRVEQVNSNLCESMEKQSSALKEKQAVLRSSNEDLASKQKQDLQMLLDKLDSLAFLGKRCDLMDKRVENCFHLVKEVRVHLNL